MDLLPPERTLTNGLQFGDVVALADALAQWFADPAATIREGIVFYDFLRETSDPDSIAKQYQSIYTQLTAD